MDVDKLSSRFLLEVNPKSRSRLRPLSIADIEIEIANGSKVRIADFKQLTDGLVSKIQNTGSKDSNNSHPHARALLG